MRGWDGEPGWPPGRGPSGGNGGGNGAGTIDVSICICTFKRAHVAETIRSILKQERTGPIRVEIIVADDDPAFSAEGAVLALAIKTPGLPIRHLRVGARNVSAARNACLDAARGKFIAFIDDDEIADPQWLATLRSVQALHDADIVKGYVHAVYPDATPDWVRAADPFTRDYGATGSPPDKLATGNVLFRREKIGAHRFNLEFGRTGGEDTDFFRRVAVGGVKAVAAREAIVHEIVPPDRVTRAYFAKRARRTGQVEERKIRLGASDEARSPKIVKALAGVLTFWPNPILRAVHPRLAYKTFAKFWYCYGIIESALLHRSDEMT